jgi:prepilin-type N-terminal cleavage/methylation domain-containing protein
MFMIRNTKKSSGFTLIELAIVLAITGVLFVGLYRLLSGGNAQLKDSSVASQQIQLINSVKGFLNTSDGQSWLAAEGLANGYNSNVSLPLPTAANAPDGGQNTNCKNGYTNNYVLAKSFCDNLPANFSAATINAYGQTFLIQVQIGSLPTNGVAGTTPPTAYSFMIVTQGGPPNADLISDADGGRISAQIGGDGGFIYQVSSCGAQACGSYGAWQASLTGAAPGGYGFGASPGAGHVASRTYVAGESNSGTPWLARSPQPGDTSNGGAVPAPIPTNPSLSPFYETMTTALYVGGQNLYMSNTNNVSTPITPPLGVGHGNTLYLQGSPIMDNAIDPANGGLISLIVASSGGNPNTFFIHGSPLAVLTTNCTVDSQTAINLNQAPNGIGINYSPGDSVNNLGSNACKPALNIIGDENINGLLQASSLFSGTFIYKGSDIRLKTDIQPIAHALDTVMELKPVSYALKAGGHKGLGFIAQDLEKIYPELVLNSDNPNAMRGVDYDGLIAPLVAAVQELKKQNDELRNALHEQALREEKLEQKLNQKQP